MPVKISVIIPIRNRPELLFRAVESVAGQALPSELYEIIVVGNASSVAVDPK